MIFSDGVVVIVIFYKGFAVVPLQKDALLDILASSNCIVPTGLVRCLLWHLQQNKGCCCRTEVCDVEAKVSSARSLLCVIHMSLLSLFFRREHTTWIHAELVPPRNSGKMNERGQVAVPN